MQASSMLAEAERTPADMAGAGHLGPSARALELMDQLNDQDSPIRKQLCVAVHRINMAMIAEHQRPLTQIWLPGFSSDGVMALTCDSAPYAVGGDSDLCARFRCVSCQYTFRPTSTHKQGSIGRVFVTHQPEACNSISEVSTTMFHRAREAKECALRSMCTMPLWVPEITKNAPMAVMEILQPEYQTDFDFLHEVAIHSLKSVTETCVTINAPGVMQSHSSRGEAGPAVSSVQDDPTPTERGHSKLRSFGEGNSGDGNSGASPGLPEAARHVGESAPGGAIPGAAIAPQDGKAPPKPKFQSLLIPLSGNSCATPSSGQTPDTQITTGATVAPPSDEHAAGFRRSPSPTARTTAGPIASGSVPGFVHLSPVDPAASTLPQAPSNNALSGQQHPPGSQRAPTLTQTSARHAHALQEAAQQRVLAFVQAQAHARANDAAMGLDMLSLTAPSSGDLQMDARLASVGPPQLQRTLTHPAHSQLSHSGGITGSGEVPGLADAGRTKAASGQLGVPAGHVMGSHGNHKDRAAASGQVSGTIPMQDIHSDPFADAWEQLGGGDGARMPGGGGSYAGRGSRPVQRGLGGSMQLPNTCHRPRVEPLSSPPSRSPQGRRLRHVMEEGVRTTSDGDGHGISPGRNAAEQRDSVSASEILTALQSESHKYVVQKVFSEADLDDSRPGSVRARKKRISPGPGRRNFGGLPDMPGPSTALPSLPDITDDMASLPRSADAVLGTRSGTGLTSPPHPATGDVATAADRGASLPSPQYDAQLRQFLHPGAGGGQDTFVRVAHSAGANHLPEKDFQRASSTPFRAGGVPSQANAGKIWKVAGQGHAGAGGQADDRGPSAAPLGGLQGGGQNLAGAHVMYQNYANDVKALRSKVNRIDGGIGRKVTLDVLKLQFGKGLKEAADNLGMCPTTLKRACRRLGVKRWPRTAEAANQLFSAAYLHPLRLDYAPSDNSESSDRELPGTRALTDAEAMERETSTAGRSEDDKDAVT